MQKQQALLGFEADDDYLLKHVNSVALMPVVGGRRISLLGRKLFNVLLHRAQEQGEQEEYEARLYEIASDAAYNSNDMGPIRKILRELMGTTVEWQSPTSGEVETWDACNLLSGAGTTKDKRTGAVTVRWRYDSKVRAQLLSPDRYARLSLEAITQLNTHAAMALYEICARYVDNPRHLTARQHWRWWRPVLTGVASNDSKAEYRFFKRDVLNRAIAEINACTNLEVRGPIEHKEKDNRTIAEIQFEVRHKSYAAPARNVGRFEGVVVDELPIIGRAITLGLSQAEAEDLVRQHGGQVLGAALDKLEQRQRMPSDKVGAVLKPAGWLRAYLTKSSRAAAEPSAPATSESSAAAELPPAEVQKHRAAWTEEWLRRRSERLRLGFLELPPAEQENQLEAFRQHLERSDQSQVLKRLNGSGWQHRLVMTSFMRFYATQVIGPDWDKPSTDDLLAVAADLAASRPVRAS